LPQPVQLSASTAINFSLTGIHLLIVPPKR
jgi:hypothetical protein